MSSKVQHAYRWMMSAPNIYGPMSVQVYWYSRTIHAGGVWHPTRRYMVNPNPDDISRYTRRMEQVGVEQTIREVRMGSSELIRLKPTPGG